MADIKGQKEVLFGRKAQYRVKSVSSSEQAGIFDTTVVNVELEEIYNENGDAFATGSSVDVISPLWGDEIQKFRC
ncbi:hypothetical protein FACS18949_14410 [Clostridia bacterium]|nr:hypothetical protein FACS18949_14410 [Clostridia bacterium]